MSSVAPTTTIGINLQRSSTIFEGTGKLPVRSPERTHAVHGTCLLVACAGMLDRLSVADAASFGSRHLWNRAPFGERWFRTAFSLGIP